MRDSEKLAEIKQARHDLLPPPKKHSLSVDNAVAPSPFSVMPSRIFADSRILNASIRVLGTICCHANQHSGIVFTNQLTIANRLGISKQAVSRQMRLLEKCGYIKKIYKENPLRKKGRKGFHPFVVGGSQHPPHCGNDNEFRNSARAVRCG